MARILAFSGSARHGSFNQYLVTIAAAGASNAGADVTLVNLRDFQIPFYNADLEETEGMPEPARHLKELIAESDGLLIASPEYNSSYTPLLKNAIDWTSRPNGDNEKPLSAWQDKKVALLGASPGRRGGARSVAALRTLLENIGVEVLEEVVTVPQAYEKFGDDGTLQDEDLDRAARDLGAALAGVI